MIVDLFAGPGGWDVAAQALGLDPEGVEWDKSARETRAANGLRTADEPDVRKYVPAEPVTGQISSPPCQTFSLSGKGAGRAALDDVLVGVQAIEMGLPLPPFDDERTALVLEPLRFALEHTPRWLAWEQVPTVLPVWEACAVVLRAQGYNVWTGKLHAEEYGVPQTRTRAVLIASLDRKVGKPRPTHTRYVKGGPRQSEGRQPWVSMADALGWGMARPYLTISASGSTGGPSIGLVGGSAARAELYEQAAAEDWVPNPSSVVGFPRLADTDDVVTFDGVDYRARDLRPDDQPAQVVTEKARSWQRFIVGAGRTGEGRPRLAETEPAPTITGKATAAWIDGIENWDHPSNPALSTNVLRENATVREIDEPAPTITGGKDSRERQWVAQHAVDGDETCLDWVEERPSPTIVGSFEPDVVAAPGYRKAGDGPRQKAPGSVRVSMAEAALLQSFPADYVWKGARTKAFQQIGNAIPPRLALHILAEALGYEEI